MIVLFLEEKEKREEKSLSSNSEIDTQQARCSTPQSSHSTTQHVIYMPSTPNHGLHYPTFFYVSHVFVRMCESDVWLLLYLCIYLYVCMRKSGMQVCKYVYKYVMWVRVKAMRDMYL